MNKVMSLTAFLALGILAATPALSAQNNSAATRTQNQASNSQTSMTSADMVRNVQRTLKAKGYRTGPADGIMGRQTRAALRSFQRSQGLQENGQIDARTLSALGIRSSESATGAQNGTIRMNNQGNMPERMRH